MGSQLQVESIMNRGSVFYFEIILESEHDESVVHENLDKIKNVLIVDDNKNNRLIISKMLALKHITSVEASSGFEAIELIENLNSFDVILMDYHMPDLDGLATIQKIREVNKSTVKNPEIILLHSSSDETIVKTCEELSINHRLLKPIKLKDMYNCLSRVISKKLEKTIVPVQESERIDEPIQVLIAEDNVVNMVLARTIVRRIAPNAKIFEANTGLEAVAIYMKTTIDIILMDIQMPEMNGYEATKAIRTITHKPYTPIIALTAGNVKGEKEKCLAAGMNDFISKPVVAHTIALSLKRWLKNHCDDLHEDEPLSQEQSSNVHLNLERLKAYIGDDDSVLTNVLSLLRIQLMNYLTEFKEISVNTDLSELLLLAQKVYDTAKVSGLTALTDIAKKLTSINTYDETDVNDLLQQAQREIEISIEVIADKILV